MTYTRFRHRYHVNRFGMRSDDFPARKSAENEIRIMVFGDSVVNAGAAIPQSEIATEILRSKIAAETKRPVVVGNVSAKSWGPPNLLAYARHFGFLDADVVVIVLSSHDAFDIPDGRPVVGIDSDYPAKKPPFAMSELFFRYAVQLLPKGPAKPKPAPSEDDRRISMAALRELITLAKASGAEVLIAQHLERDEDPNSPLPGYRYIAEVAKAADIPTIPIGRALKRSGNPAKFYSDTIHPTAEAQPIIAQTLFDLVMKSLRNKKSETN